MKRVLFILILMSVLFLNFTSCSSSVNNSSNNSESSNTDNNTDNSDEKNKKPNDEDDTQKPVIIGNQTTPSAGAILFNDGSYYSPRNGTTGELTQQQKDAAIAVVFSDGTFFSKNFYALGIKTSKTSVAWCSSDADAYDKNIETIQCKFTSIANRGKYTFNFESNADTNGADNLSQIESFEGVNDTADATKYPAFYFAKEYYKTATNLGEKYKTGWYLPTAYELTLIYNEIDTINNKLELCGGDLLNTHSMSGKVYWTSSQSDKTGKEKSGLSIHFGTGKIDNDDKSTSDDENFALAIYKINAN